VQDVSWAVELLAGSGERLSGRLGASELDEVAAEFVADASEQRYAIVFRAMERSGIIERVMQVLRGAEEHWASFAGAVANRDHVIEMPALELRRISSGDC
jgi:hypothetical protein